MAAEILLGVAAYFCLAGPVAIVVSRMLAGPPPGLAGEAGTVARSGAEGPAGSCITAAHVTAGRSFALVAGHPHAAGHLQ